MKPKVAIPLALGGMFFGAAITIANAEKRFDGHPYLLYVCLGVAIAMIATAVFGAVIDVIRKPKDQADEHRPPINIHLENIGNPIQKQSIEQRVSVPLSDPARKIQLPETKPLPSRRARLSNFSQFASNTPLLLLPFRNDSIVGQDLEFSAHIVYRDSDLIEITDVARGTWFPLTRNPLRTNFETGMTRELALLFFSNGKPFKPVIHWHQEGFGRRAIRHPEIWPEADEINQTISTIEVRLLSRANEPMIFKFELIKDDTNPFPSLLRRD